MTSSTLNESEILKSLVRKGAVADLFRDMYPQTGSSPLKQSAGKMKQVEDQEV